MAQRQVHVPVFSNQDDASEDVLYTRRSRLAVKNRVPKVSAKNSEAYAHDGQAPVKEKGFSSDGTTRKIRKKRRKQGYGNYPEGDVIVPPFEDWEMNPESAEKYTDVFQVIGDSRKSPGTPIKLSIESDTHKKDPNECKGCRCLSWIFKCKSCW
ncbi:uncharacterized protein LOC135631476 isoform X2 [Musa acuminata AAA Group]|uniref:uncharacterized protein LOC135631476 isoform X2 n=1 Tax=Musa acuminata AAA Group TaxID=214697 RepID=UPI0031E123DF